MSWQKYTPTTTKRPDVAVSISIPDEGSRGSPFILIDEATIKALGWKADSRIMLSIGTAEHDGKLRLEPAAGEPLRVLPPKGIVKRHRITVGRLPCLGTDRVRGACGYEVEKVTGGRRFGHHASQRRTLSPATARHGGGRRLGRR